MPKGSKVDNRGLMWRLNHYMAGERVIAVGYGEPGDPADWSDEAFKRERSVIGKLQLVCANHSPKDVDLIPFKVGSTYVVAPEMRDEANVDLSRLSEFDLASRGLLIDQALLAMPENQLAALGSENGLAARSLPADIVPALVRAFRPPLKIINYKPITYTNDSGVPQAGVTLEDKGRVNDPLDWTSVRVRARIRVPSVYVDTKPYGVGIGIRNLGLSFAALDDQQRSYMNRGLDMPVYTEAPNTYKPSDLIGKTFTQPLNAAGIFTVEELANRLEKATGLRLSIWKPARTEPVFIGSNAVTAGEVIDGLRLALTGAWRRLGNTYILAYDRIGIQGVQQLARESAAATAKALRKRNADSERSTDWVKIVDGLPFDTSDPLRLSTDQRDKLFNASTETKVSPGDLGRISFTEMTPEQQAWVRSEAKNSTINLPGTEGQPAVNRPVTEDDLRSAYIQGYLGVQLEVQVPGTGWVRAGDDWNRHNITAFSIRDARQRLAKGGAGTPRDLLAEAPPEIRDLIKNPQPFSPPAASRGMMVPPIGAGRLTVLADEMKRHGLNVLFYPVLFDGYATIASKAFPLHPSLRGADGWEAATAAMAPKGIKVVGYLRTLSWRDAGSKPHYLTAHPDWLDVDVLGRARGKWYESHSDTIAKIASMGVIAGDYVRPGEPMVSAKLQTLLGEFARKPGSAGVCFLEWRPDSTGPDMAQLTSLNAPRLGYGVPDRIAALERTGTDPVDRVESWDDFVPPALEHQRWALIDRTPVPGGSPHQLLISDLIARAKSLRKDWKVWVGDSLGPDLGITKDKVDPTKQADEVIGGMFGAMMSGTGRKNMLLPVTRNNMLTALAGEELGSDSAVPDEILKMPSIVTYSLFFSMKDAGAAFTNISSVILDFRTAPEEITSSLQWIKAPDNKQVAPAKPKPPT